MKKISSRIIAVILVMCMILPIVPAWALAGDLENNGTGTAVSFKLEKTEETKDYVSLKLSITEGKALCFDVKVTSSDNLICTGIKMSDDVKSFINDNSEGTFVANTDTGMFSFVNTVDLSATADIAELTYSKTTSDGVAASDFTVSVTTCYQTGEDGSDVQPSVSVVNAISENHTHVSSGDVVVLEPATCLKQGSGVIYCTECGEIAEYIYIEQLAHTEKEERVEPTCYEDGYVLKYCTVCNTELQNTVLPKLNHQNAVNQHKDATCTEDGYDRTYCPDCQQYFDVTVIPATGHQHTEIWHKDATCTENGYDRVYCNDCQKVISETVIKATGHNIVTESKDATCTEDGYYKEYCSACDEVYKNEVYPKTGHQNVKTVVVDATCTEDGSVDSVCEDCGTVIKHSVVTAEGHKFVSDVKTAGCTTEGYICIKCSKCGIEESKTILKATGHSWTEWQIIKEATAAVVGNKRRVCRNCGMSQEEEIPRIVVPAEKIIITPGEDFVLHVKMKDKIQADVYPEDAAYSAEIVFESSNPGVVSVDEDGNIVAKSRGTATITAKTADGKVSASVNVTVDYSTIQMIIIYLLFGWIWYL